jgi:hypothetical protein
MHYIHCKKRPNFGKDKVEDDTIKGLYSWMNMANTVPPILQQGSITQDPTSVDTGG